MNWTILWSKIKANSKAISELKNLSPFSYKGSVATVADLPSDANKGDVYTVEENGEEFVYTGIIWMSLSKDIEESDIQKALGYIPPSKQYVDEEDDKLKQRITDIEESRLPNVIIHGVPVINGSQMSGFSAESYAKFPFLVTLAHPFEIKFAISTGENVTEQQNVLDSDFGLAFAIKNAKLVIALSTNGTSWDLGESIGSLNVQPNTSYLIKILWDGSKYEVAYSLDAGATYITDITVSSSSPLYPKQIYIGVGENYGEIFNYFEGIIDFRYASLSVNNQPIWLGYADINLLTRLAVDLENIDASGIEKIENIIGNASYIRQLLDENEELAQPNLINADTLEGKTLSQIKNEIMNDLLSHINNTN